MKAFVWIALLSLWIGNAGYTKNWPDFRGPNGDGHAQPLSSGDTRGLPLNWSEEENIVWKTPIPHRGWSSPVVWGNQVWLTTATEDGHEMFYYCLDLETGEVIHHRKLFHVDNPEPLGNDVNGYATCSPTIEEGRVYIHFGSYGTACIDTETGEEIWQRRDLPCRHFRGPASSPVIFGETLILTMDGVDVQYLVALDKHTGETVWKTHRTTDFDDLGPDGEPIAEGDLRKAYTTPIFVDVEGETQMISVGARSAFAYNPHDGEELWQVRYPGFSNASRPIAGHGLTFINTGYGRADLLGVKLGGEGDITESHVEWQLTQSVPLRSSPVLVDDLIYMVTDGGVASAVEALTGEAVWRERLGGQFSASPIYADGRLYFFNEFGVGTVLEPGREFTVLATNELDDGCMASPAVVGGALIVRTKTHVYRIES